MGRKIFVTGIDTDIGKTVVSAVLVEALQADYWKPVQAGDLDNSDSHKVKAMVTNPKSKFHPSSYELEYPMSPHASADLEGRHVDLSKIRAPHTENDLVIEGAGGLLVPLNHEQTLADWLTKDLEIVLVIKHYLGNINHSLLSLEALKNRGLNLLGIVINGEANPASEQIIEELSGVKIIARVNQLPETNALEVHREAQIVREQLKPILEND